MRRKIICSEEATPASKQLTKPCSDCPWAREAFPGWLGACTIEEWLGCAHSDAAVPCHVHPNVQCAGIAIFRGNVYKVPRDPEVLRLSPDRTIVFSNNAEFREHHEGTIEAKLRAKIAADKAKR